MSDSAFLQKYGPWALVIGGSKGIGAAYSEQLAAKGLNLVITARGEQELSAISSALQQRYGIKVLTVSLDLNDENVLQQLLPTIAPLEIGLLVYNTAYYDIKEFLSSSLENHLRTLNVNCRSLLVLAHHLGLAMSQRKRGGMIFMSSMSGWQGAALLSTYAATKAFDTVLGEGLWDEMRAHNIDVLSFVAGATRTPNFLGMTPQDKQAQAFPMNPEDVAREALNNLGKTPIQRAGIINKIAGFVILRCLPRRLAIQFMSKANRNLYG